MLQTALTMTRRAKREFEDFPATWSLILNFNSQETLKPNPRQIENQHLIQKSIWIWNGDRDNGVLTMTRRARIAGFK